MSMLQYPASFCIEPPSSTGADLIKRPWVSFRENAPSRPNSQMRQAETGCRTLRQLLDTARPSRQVKNSESLYFERPTSPFQAAVTLFRRRNNPTLATRSGILFDGRSIASDLCRVKQKLLAKCNGSDLFLRLGSSGKPDQGAPSGVRSGCVRLQCGYRCERK